MSLCSKRSHQDTAYARTQRINPRSHQTMQIGIDYTSAARQRAGIGRYTRELVSSLLALDRSHQYTVFAATGGLAEGRWQEELHRIRAPRDQRLTVRSVPLTDDWLARLWHRLRLPIPVEIVTGRLDAFYSPDFTLPPTRPATRTLLTVHDLSFVRHPEAFVPSLRQYLERAVLSSIRRANVVLADSAHTRSDLLTLFGIPPEKVEIITPGVDSRFQPAPCPGDRARLREQYGVGDEPYVLSLGTVQPRKNYVRLIQAFARISEGRQGSAQPPLVTDPRMQLVIAGGRGWLYEDILAEADKHERVRLLGFVDDEDLPALYREAALFAFPSLYEGFGLPVLEAMACGVPVVCSNTSSLPEVAGDAALLVDPLDVEGLSEAMVRALQDDELRESMITRGLAQAASFTWERSARRLLHVITSGEKR